MLLWKFFPSGRFVPIDVWSSERFIPLDVLSFRTFCPYGHFAQQILCPWLLFLWMFFLRIFCPSGRFISGCFVWAPSSREVRPTMVMHICLFGHVRALPSSGQRHFTMWLYPTSIPLSVLISVSLCVLYCTSTLQQFIPPYPSLCLTLYPPSLFIPPSIRECQMMRTDQIRIRPLFLRQMSTT